MTPVALGGELCAADAAAARMKLEAPSGGGERQWHTGVQRVRRWPTVRVEFESGGDGGGGATPRAARDPRGTFLPKSKTQPRPAESRRAQRAAHIEVMELYAAPRELSPRASQFWYTICAMGIDEGGLLDLEQAMLFFDLNIAAQSRMMDARGHAGRTVLGKDRFGQRKEHPAFSVAVHSSKRMREHLHAVGLDIEPKNAKPGRPPREL